MTYEVASSFTSNTKLTKICLKRKKHFFFATHFICSFSSREQYSLFPFNKLAIDPKNSLPCFNQFEARKFLESSFSKHLNYTAH